MSKYWPIGTSRTCTYNCQVICLNGRDMSFLLTSSFLLVTGMRKGTRWNARWKPYIAR